MEHIFVNIVELFIASFSVTKVIKKRKKSGYSGQNAGQIPPNHPEIHSVSATLLLVAWELGCAFSLLFLGGNTPNTNRATFYIFKKETTSKHSKEF